MQPLFKPYMPLNMMDGINKILYSGKLAFGEWGKLFEDGLRQYFQNNALLVVNNYSSALNVAMTVFDLGPGDEVIASPVCCLQSSQPLVAKGIKIIWADVDPDTGTLSPESIEGSITSKTKAIIHNQHLGYVGYIDEINSIAKKYGLITIDDCTDGMGGIYKGQKVGNCGSDATVFSFQTVRLPNAIEGGAVILKDRKYFEKAKIIRDLGINRSLFRDERGEISPKLDISNIGFAALMNEINAYIAFNQISSLDALINKQRQNAESWILKINKEKLNCSAMIPISDTIPNYWIMGLFSNKKNEMIEYFRNIGFYASSIHLNNNRYSLFGSKKELKGVNEFYDKFLAVPSGWWVDNILQK